MRPYYLALLALLPLILSTLDGPPDQTLQCNLALEAVCEEAREEDVVSCLLCTGAHQSNLDAKCSNAMLQAFCSNTSCIAKLADSCGGHNAESGSCFDCVQCASGHNATTGCGLDDATQFCEATTRPPQPPDCDATLTALCNTTRSSTVECIMCAGHYEEYVDEAKCSDAQISNFCHDNSCYSAMRRVCGDTVGKSCGQCAVCVTQIQGSDCSIEDKRSFCDSGCFGAVYEWNHTQLLLPNISQHTCVVPSPVHFKYFQSSNVALQLVPTHGYVSMAGTVTAGPHVNGQDMYTGGVLLPDGRVVLVPFNAATIGLYDPATNTLRAGPNVNQNDKYLGGVLLPDGRVVLVPCTAATIGLYDPATNTMTVGPNVNGQNGKYCKYLGGVLLPDGRVVLVPNNAATIGLYDPATNTLRAGPNVGITNQNYCGGVLLPDGRVVLVPCNAATIGLYDPATNTLTVGPNVNGQNQYFGGVLLPDGRVVLVPCNATTIGLYDPATNTLRAGPNVNQNDKYLGGVLLPDGRVVLVPNNAATIGLYDPATNTMTVGPNVNGQDNYCGGVLLPDGRVVLVPNAATIGLYDPGESLPPAYTLSRPLPLPWNALLLPYYNKL